MMARKKKEEVLGGLIFDFQVLSNLDDWWFEEPLV